MKFLSDEEATLLDSAIQRIKNENEKLKAENKKLKRTEEDDFKDKVNDGKYDDTVMKDIINILAKYKITYEQSTMVARVIYLLDKKRKNKIIEPIK